MRQALQSVSMNSMAIDRRALLLGTLSFVGAAGLGARGGLAAEAADQAAFVAAARVDQGFAILTLAHDGTVLRQVPLEARGHDIAIDRKNNRAVAFARRPGTFAVAFDLDGRREPIVFNAAEGRHFYGHGAFSADGRLLYVSENDIAAGRGVIGFYDAAAGFKKLGEMPSHGVGPHEIILLDDGRTLAVANGGIDTVPEAGRAMLNLEDMKPNLAFVDALSGALLARHELPSDLNRLSIRHIAADAHGAVWFGGQWEGDLAETPELIGRASRDTPLRLIEPDVSQGLVLKGYIGSVAASGNGAIIGASAPKAGKILYIAAESGFIIGESALPDGCGIAGEAGEQFAVSSGMGTFRHELPCIGSVDETQPGAPRVLDERRLASIAFDNHLRRI